ncbi:GyrI-like domain-containing protein [Rothia sp. LK2492]|uniref:GyrI-like domain-containing protein n=1 Tax=Rothia sp. LK2492 TaxID=3114370 RepID=UPI0034CF728F
MNSPASTFETALIEYGTFMVAGVTAPASEQSVFSDWWQELYKKLEQGENGTAKLAAVEKLQRVGVIMPDADDAGATYTAGFIVPGGIKDVVALGLTGVMVPAAMYATVLVQGAVLAGETPQHIKEGFEHLHTEFLPSKRLVPTGVHLEVYGPGEMTSKNYRMYLWTATTPA